MSFTTPLSTVIAENFNGLLSTAPHWQRIPLGDLAVITNGIPLPSAGFNPAKGSPVVRIRNVLAGSTDTYFDGDVEDEWFISPGDLLVGMDGDFHPARWRGPRALLNQRVCKVAPKDERVTTEYLSYILPGYLEAVNKHTPSITVKHLSSRTMAELPIPVPPRAELDALVSQLETQLSRLDAAAATLTRLKAEVKRARASVFKAAVEGRLVPTEAALAKTEGRGYEPASEILKRLQRDRASRSIGKGKTGAPTEPAMPDATEGRELPEGWAWGSLSQLGEWSSGGTPSRSETRYYSGPIPWVKTGELVDREIRETEEHISETAVENSSAKIHPVGTLLVAMYGATIGMTGRLAMPAATNQACAALLPNPANLSLMPYVWQYLVQQREELRRVGQGGAQPNISQAILKAWPIPLPPLAEQSRILADLDRRTSVLDEVAATLEATLSRCVRLRQSILKRAFEGRLVDPRLASNGTAA